jgi:hypothetical protein
MSALIENCPPGQFGVGANTPTLDRMHSQPRLNSLRSLLQISQSFLTPLPCLPCLTVCRFPR